MEAKTWVFWVGLLIVALAIIGFIGGVLGLIAPMPRYHFRTEEFANFAPIAFRATSMRLIGSAVFLVIGVYMMLKGKVQNPPVEETKKD